MRYAAIPLIEGLGMGVITWIILGLVAGFIASKIVDRHGAGFLLAIVMGIVGALWAAGYSHSWGRMA